MLSSFISVPGPPMEVLLHPVSSTSMKGTWKVPREKNGLLKDYKVEFYRMIDNQTVLNQTSHLSQLMWQVSGLKAYSPYRLCVTAQTSFGYGKSSCAESITLAPSRFRSFFTYHCQFFRPESYFRSPPMPAESRI